MRDPDPPIQPRKPLLAGVDIKAPPKVKVLLTHDTPEDLEALEKELNNGWKMASSFNHPNGILFVLAKE